MNPEDDPEARIRALEQPLADAARSSELGGSQPGGYSSQPYPPPAPPPPPLYGDYSAGGYNSGFGAGYNAPFSGAPLSGGPRRSSGNRLFWILAAVFVVGMLAVVGGIAAYVANRVSSSNVIVEPSTPSTSVFSSPRSPNPSTTRTRTPTAGPSTPSTPAPGSNLSIAGINQNRTVACNNNSVTVSGVSNTITISGHCTKLTVSGMQNTITVDAVDTIDASGLNNQVTYHSGSPQISKSGDGNVVQQG